MFKYLWEGFFLSPPISLLIGTKELRQEHEKGGNRKV